MPIPSLSSSTLSSSSSSSLWRRAFVTSQPASRYLPPVRTGGPAMMDGGAGFGAQGCLFSAE